MSNKTVTEDDGGAMSDAQMGEVIYGGVMSLADDQPFADLATFEDEAEGIQICIPVDTLTEYGGVETIEILIKSAEGV